VNGYDLREKGHDGGYGTTIPAVLTASDIARILQISRPQSYLVMHQCKPFSIGRLKRCLAEDFRAYLDSQRA